MGGCTPRSPFFSPSWALPCTFLHSAEMQLSCFQSIVHSFAQFCRHAELNSFLFNQFRTLLQKHPGGGHVLKENRLAVVALRDAADVFAGIHQPLIVGTVSFFQWRGFFPTLQVRRPSRQGRGAGSCCETSARLPRNLAAPFLAPSLHPQVRRVRPPSRQGRGAGSCCETSARLPRNLVFLLLARSLPPPMRLDRPPYSRSTM